MVESSSLSHSQRQLWPAAGSADRTDTHDVRSPRRPRCPQRGAPVEGWCAVMRLTRPSRGGVKLPAVEIEGTVRRACCVGAARCPGDECRRVEYCED